MPEKQKKTSHHPSQDTLPYFSPRDLAERWRCSRTSVHRIAEHASFRKMILGDGKHAGVRYLRVDVEAYERSRSV